MNTIGSVAAFCCFFFLLPFWSAQAQDANLLKINIEDLLRQPGHSTLEQAELLIEKGRQHIFYAEYDAGEACIKRAEILLSDLQEFSPEMAACVKQEKGRLFRILGRLKETRTQFLEALSFCPANTTQKASIFLDMAELEWQYGSYSSADSLIRLANDILDRHPFTDTGELINFYILQGHQYYHQWKNDAAAIFYQKALTLTGNAFSENHPLYGSCLQFLGQLDYLKGDIPAAETKLAAAETIFQQAYRKPHPDIAFLYRQFGKLEGFKNDFEKAKDYYQKAIDVFTGLFGDRNLYLAEVYSSLALDYGLNQFGIEGLYKSLEYNLLALSIKQAYFGEVSIPVAVSYHDIGNVYGQMDKTPESIEYLEHSFKIYEKLHALDDFHLSKLYSDLGSAYSHKGDLNKGLLFLDRSVSIQERLNADNNAGLLLSYIQISMSYPVLQKQLLYADKAIELAEGLYGKDNIVTSLTMFLKGSIFYNFGEYLNAIEVMEPVIETIRNSFYGQSPLLISTMESMLANCYVQTGKFEKSLQILEQISARIAHIEAEGNAIKANISILNAKTFAGLNQWDKALEISGSVLQKMGYPSGTELEDPGLWINLLQTRAEILFQSYFQYNNPDLLDEAQAILEDLDQIMLRAKQDLLTERDQTKFSDKNFRIYELWIKTDLERAGIRNKAANQKNAFRTLEKAKYSSMLRSLQSSTPKAFYNVPDSLIDQERWLIGQIRELEKKGGGAVGLSMGSLLPEQPDREAVEKLFFVRKALDNLTDTFRVRYPEYFQLKNRPSFVSIDSLQKNRLAADETILQYYVADSVIYAFIIKKTAFEVIPLKKDFPLNEWIEAFRQGLTGYYTSEDKPDTLYLSSLGKYAEAAYNLYAKLIAPFKDLLTQKLIIIPDGRLNFIPFEALLTSQPKVIYRLNTYNYLLDNYTIHYNYSATLFYEVTNQPERSFQPQRLAAFAPRFDALTNRDEETGQSPRLDQLNPLKYNIAEALEIAGLCRGKAFTDTAATLANFLNHSEEFETIHFSTHALLDRKGAEFSFLVFQPLSGHREGELLFTQDIYGLRLNPNAMIVLSACETAYGPLSRTEGLASIARAFMYAGAKTIIPTLWSINDEKTKDLMISFYQYLKAGLPKNEALCQAKKDYIRNNPGEKAHPYFWSAFIGIGDMR